MRFNEITSLMPSQLDFVPRQRRNQVGWLVIAFFMTAMLVFAVAYAPVFSKSSIYAPLVAIILIAVLCLYVVRRHQLLLDLVMATEYQNMLFANVTGIGSSFSIVARRDGTIVYASDGLSAIFPGFHYGDAMALEGVFNQGVVRLADRERIMGAIHSNTSDHLIFPVNASGGTKKDYILTVEPLARPSGFAVIRGREYLGQRTGAELMPDILRSTSIDKLDHLLATTSAALYTTDAFGRFEYVNPAFERLFGYEPGSILESKLSLHHLVFSMGMQLLTEEYRLHDYSGEAVLLHRDGTRYRVGLSQSLLRDTTGKTMGATGSILVSPTP